MCSIATMSKERIARVFVLWFGFIFLSPALGIHIHHDKNTPVIHSYFFSDHDSNHLPSHSPPEPLTDHISGVGIIVNLSQWDAIPFINPSFLNQVLTNYSIQFFSIIFFGLPIVFLGFFSFNPERLIKITNTYYLSLIPTIIFGYQLSSKCNKNLIYLPPPSLS